MPQIKKPEVDAVIVGMGWTGAIMGTELTEAGLNVVGLERGEKRESSPEFAYPAIADGPTYIQRRKLMQNLARETVMIRHSPGDDVLPYRRAGAFLLGNGVGGAGVHWNCTTWRVNAADLKIRLHLQALGQLQAMNVFRVKDYRELPHRPTPFKGLCDAHVRPTVVSRKTTPPADAIFGTHRFGGTHRVVRRTPIARSTDSAMVVRFLCTASRHNNQWPVQ